jgi:hypothetical protein
MLLVLRKLGLVWNIRLPADLPVRHELRALDGAALASPHSISPGFACAWRLLGSARRNGVHSEG